jgi:HPt (histidine-containing phosphotransfer) domain-containing protein
MSKRQDGKLDDATVRSFGDYEVIVPKRNLRSYITKAEGPDDGFGGIDPEAIARAEAALEELSKNFDNWMEKEVLRLTQARDTAVKLGLDEMIRADLYSAAHDIKGEAATFGYPLAARVADSLTKLLEAVEDPRLVPWPLANQHVDTIRAIVREVPKDTESPVALELVDRLIAVTEEKLVELTGAPPLAPQPEA